MARQKYRMPGILEGFLKIDDVREFEVEDSATRRSWVLPIATEPANFDIVVSEGPSAIVFETKICNLPTPATPTVAATFYRGLLESNAHSYHGKLGVTTTSDGQSSVVYSRELPKAGLPVATIVDELKLFVPVVTQRFTDVVRMAKTSDFAIEIGDQDKP